MKDKIFRFLICKWFSHFPLRKADPDSDYDHFIECKICNLRAGIKWI